MSYKWSQNNWPTCTLVEWRVSWTLVWLFSMFEFSCRLMPIHFGCLSRNFFFFKIDIGKWMLIIWMSNECIGNSGSYISMRESWNVHVTYIFNRFYHNRRQLNVVGVIHNLYVASICLFGNSKRRQNIREFDVKNSEIDTNWRKINYLSNNEK